MNCLRLSKKTPVNCTNGSLLGIMRYMQDDGTYPNRVQADDQAAPQAGASTTGKEQEPIPSSETAIEDHREIKVSKEVEPHVKVVKDTVEIPPDLKKAGVSKPPSQTSVSDATSTSQKLPMSDDQIGEGLHASITSSARWLAEWCLKQLRAVHVHLKKVHGHFVREKD